MLIKKFMFTICTFISLLLMGERAFAQEFTFNNPVFSDIYHEIKNHSEHSVVEGTCHGGTTEVLRTEHDKQIPMGFNIRPNGTHKFKDRTAQTYCRALGYVEAVSYSVKPLQDLTPPLTPLASGSGADDCADNLASTITTVKSNIGDTPDLELNYRLQWHYYRGVPSSWEWSYGVFTSIVCDDGVEEVVDTSEDNTDNIVYNPKASFLYPQFIAEGRYKLIGNCASNFLGNLEFLNDHEITVGYSLTRNGQFKDRDATLVALCNAQGYGTVVDHSAVLVTQSPENRCDNYDRLLLSGLDPLPTSTDAYQTMRIVRGPTADRGWHRYKINSVECDHPYVIRTNSYSDNTKLLGYSITDLGDLDGDGPSIKALAIASGSGGYSFDISNITIAFLNANLEVTNTTTIINVDPQGYDGMSVAGIAYLGDLDVTEAGGNATIAVSINGVRSASIKLFDIRADGTVVDESYTIFTRSYQGYSSISSFTGKSIVNLGGLMSTPETDTITLAVGSSTSYLLDGRLSLVTFDPEDLTSDAESTGVADIADNSIITDVSVDSLNLHDLQAFGMDMAVLGDLDGTGPGQVTLAVLAPGSANNNNDGKIYIIHLNSTGVIVGNTLIIDSHFSNLDGDYDFGYSMEFLGNYDYNGAGHLSFAVGMSRYDNNIYDDISTMYMINIDKQGNKEIVYYLDQNRKGVPSNDSPLYDSIQSRFGASITNLGIIGNTTNQATTLAIGTPKHSTYEPAAGKVYFYTFSNAIR